MTEDLQLLHAQLIFAKIALDRGAEDDFVSFMAKARSQPLRRTGWWWGVRKRGEAGDQKLHHKRLKRVDKVLAITGRAGIDRDKVLVVLRAGDRTTHKRLTRLYWSEMEKKPSPVPDEIMTQLNRLVETMERMLPAEIRPLRTLTWGGRDRPSVTVGNELWDKFLTNVYFAASDAINHDQFVSEILRGPLPKPKPGRQSEAWGSRDQCFSFWREIALKLFNLIGPAFLSPADRKIWNEGRRGKVTKTQPACRLIADLINDWYCYADLKFDSKTITARLQDRY